ncbi:MAG: AmmeMemoRadiSam system protein A [Desulfuromonadales bacterium]|nr:AmmeMemoRadiSam system protein A [Desulfuromonadales bacterium]
MLNSKEKQILLEIARKAITAAVHKEDTAPEPKEESALNMRNGCFVTIKKNSELRGCIGNFQSDLPLFKEVAAMAAASACKDPRFYPLQADELENISIDISVLSPLEKIDTIEAIEVGRHGIYLEKGYYRGVLLPQVATEHNWDRETFLKQTCLKAGLPIDSWEAEETDIYIFSAEVFSDRDS